MRLTIVAALFVSLVASQDVSLAAVKRAFDSANIPANANIKFEPTVLFELTFPQTSGLAIQAHAGVQLPRNATAGPPKFAIRNAVPTTRPFVVAAVDLDAPTPQNPTSAQIRHFLGGDFHLVPTRGTNTEPLVNSTAAVSEFRQPTPPAGSDPHRYVFLLFNQPAGFDQQTIVTPATSIANFNISQFAEEVGLGNPIGGTFILVGPDPTA
ncbi:PEBP-like protein [Panus rudis PR-1116 ss-1]|nr:PEBP-like protein [Panus rudis PR-1116 ss-1]